MAGGHRSALREKWKEAVVSVLPIGLLVFGLCLVLVPVPNNVLMGFVVGAVLLILGMGFFTLGADLAMTPIGRHVGTSLSKTKKLWIAALVAFAVGVIVTLAEPDLQVLAQQVPGVPNLVLMTAVAIGVGLFLVVAILRIVFRIRMSYLLLGAYAMLFALSAFVPEAFLAIAFDSGGVTTGPMTVPFILAVGVGVSALRSDANAENDSFGLVALCSVGPILAVMILGFIFQPLPGEQSILTLPAATLSTDLGLEFFRQLPKFLTEVTTALAPIAVFFITLQIASLHLSLKSVGRIMIGLVYTYIGLVLFLLGVNVGFMPVGAYLGRMLGAASYSWLLVPVGMVLGYMVVSAEPAVHVLNKQVYELTSGAIPPKALSLTLSIGVSVSVGLAMLRIILRIPILTLLIPGYAIALILMFFVPPIFTSIAFDSGGVASGPMTATFLLPFAMGACEAVGGDISGDAFGVVAMVAMTPLIAIQLLGLYYSIQTKRAAKQRVVEEAGEDIIEV